MPEFTAPEERRKRPRVDGKFLQVNGERFFIKGITYGPFRPDDQGFYYGTQESVEKDFADIRAWGFNTLRIYLLPPLWLLDAAQKAGLKVMLGLSWEQHISFLEYRGLGRKIRSNIEAQIKPYLGHPALLCISLGNEIPASVVRWLGHKKIEAFLKSLHHLIKQADPLCLVTYANYPTTEFLDLKFLDFLCFNVYLEKDEAFSKYLARLQNIATELPLVLGELGMDTLRNGENAQAKLFATQLPMAFEQGCAGVFVYAWTDEWYNAGREVDDWKFGITDRERRPKPALAKITSALENLPFSNWTHPWPKISVVVCTYNGSRTIRDTCEGLQALTYPNFEVIVVNDGSTDGVEKLVAEYGFKIISTPNRGLSSARNTGLEAAQGEIVAYIDDDAWPDAHWLHFLAHAFVSSSHVGVGGPNLAPPGDGLLADCVYNSPGGPLHVLFTDREAEHLPGCNMAFRREALLAVGGFDTQFRIAGDDVDLCWRLHDQGGTLGFAPTAVVWHHRRNSFKAYLKQQYNYGRAEAILEQKWQHRYNDLGHIRWMGRIYGRGLQRALRINRHRIYHGVWGLELFQSDHPLNPSLLQTLPLMPEFYLLLTCLFIVGSWGVFWPPLLWFLLACALGVSLLLLQAGLGALNAGHSAYAYRLKKRKLLRFLLTSMMHFLQPLSRLRGRLQEGLSPWRTQAKLGHSLLWWRHRILAQTKSCSSFEYLTDVLHHLKTQSIRVSCGGPYEKWDLVVRGGILGFSRFRVLAESHADGVYFARFQRKPGLSLLFYLGMGLALFLGAVAWFEHHPLALKGVGVFLVLLLIRAAQEISMASACLDFAAKKAGEKHAKQL